MCIASACLIACIPQGSELLDREDAGGLPEPVWVRISDSTAALPPAEPHAVLGLAPNHGPFSGGGRSIIRGNGYAGALRIWFGTVEVPEEDLIVIDSGRVQVSVPSHASGSVDVHTQNGDDTSTLRSLIGGYHFDSHYAEPSSGPSAGGTLITIYGDSGEWTAETEVFIGGASCQIEALRSPGSAPQELDCLTPPGSAGSHGIQVSGAAGSATVRDAFVYSYTESQARAGLSGDPLSGRLQVKVNSAFTGEAVFGARVLLDEGVDPQHQAITNSSGEAVFEGDLGPARTVTVFGHCLQPYTYVGVRVDHVKVSLSPEASPSCIEGLEFPPIVSGGHPTTGGTVSGELVWDENREFERTAFSNVPAPPSDTSHQVAYVFDTRTTPDATFRLPPIADAVTAESEGSRGYAFTLPANAGNRTLYALAGVEDRSGGGRIFSAYAMGMIRGVSSVPGEQTDEVFLNVDLPLDHSLEIDVSGPILTGRGPDRVNVTASVRLGPRNFVIFPHGLLSALLPAPGSLHFVGLPPLNGALTGQRYVATAEAVTGPRGETPFSILQSTAIGTSHEPVSLSGFVEIPVIEYPEVGDSWPGTDIRLSSAAGGEQVDLIVIDAISGGGLITWRIVAPGDIREFRLPHLDEFGDGALRPGSVVLSVSFARLENFDFGSLSSPELNPSRWDAYAKDVSSIRH
ncbi:MAG: IPT/TIG domain-containing protein [Polyangiaceae bacterium]|nr:IPT/TIG domain-containing protein [Polyangiaceae bacterium]